jgi:hypothetical protein
MPRLTGSPRFTDENENIIGCGFYNSLEGVHLTTQQTQDKEDKGDRFI